jgi:hypothetical protein
VRDHEHAALPSPLPFAQATTNACGAPTLILVMNHFACVSSSDSHSAASFSKSWSRTALDAWTAIVQVIAVSQLRRKSTRRSAKRMYLGGGS